MGTTLAIHLDVDDPRHRNAAAEILRRHDNGEPEANITSVVRDFLTSLVSPGARRWSRRTRHRVPRAAPLT